MKHLALILCMPAWLCAADWAQQARFVYVMPMFRGMDQYLVNRLLNNHVFTVVTDPKLADTFFTDRLGPGFLTSLENLTRLEKPVPPPEKKDTKEPSVPFADTANKLENPAANSSFGRGKGTVFLVDAKSREVIWAVFSPSQSSAAKEMDRAASDIVGRLMKDIGLKKK